MGFVFPFFLTKIGIRNDAPRGVIPDSVIWAFYGGAAILILCVLYTTLKVKEWNPQDYARYNGETKVAQDEKKEESNWLTLLKKAPATFWRVGLVQFFCWAAFMYMWVYTNGAIADTCWGVDMQDAHASTVQEPQVGLYCESCPWCSRLLSRAVYPSSLRSVRFIPAHRLCLGRDVGHAVHLRYECSSGLWTYGCLPRTVQWNYLCAPDYSLTLWRRSAALGGFKPDQHDVCGRSLLGIGCVERTDDKGKQMILFHEL